MKLCIDFFHQSGSGFIKTVKLSHIPPVFPGAASCPYAVEEKHQAPSYLIRGRFLSGPSTGLESLRATGNTSDISHKPVSVCLYILATAPKGQINQAFLEFDAGELEQQSSGQQNKINVNKIHFLIIIFLIQQIKTPNIFNLSVLLFRKAEAVLFVSFLF